MVVIIKIKGKVKEIYLLPKLLNKKQDQGEMLYIQISLINHQNRVFRGGAPNSEWAALKKIITKKKLIWMVFWINLTSFNLLFLT